MHHRGLPLSANVSILFPELPYPERFAAARAAGFDAVETWWPFAAAVPPRSEVDALLTAVDRAGVRLTGLNFFAGDMPAGQRGVALHADRFDELAANVALVAEIAVDTGCRHFNLLYGQLAEGQSADAARAVAGRAYRTAVEGVRGFGGTVLVEPLARGLNGAYPIQTAAQALDFLDAEVPGPGAALLFDTFHLGHNGEDLVAVATAHAHRVGHVQLADDPGRGEPGTGTLPIDAALAALVAGGYSGRAAAEYVPTRADTFGWVTA
jgi:hydroxypyruvate isomerase